MSNKELLNLSKLINDKINKKIFIKKINGERITPAYKFGSNYKSQIKFD